MFNDESYVDFVMREAQKCNKIFVVDSGEGNDCIDPDTEWYIENFSGWYVHPNEKKELLEAMKNKTAHDIFSNSYVFAEWSRGADGELKVSFQKY